jgi:PAS domain S-box-containing protein
MAELLGTDPDQLVGKLVLELVHADDFQPIIDEVRRLAAGGPPGAPQEVRLLRPDGTHLVAELASLRQEFDGEPAIFVVARDVSERRRMVDQVAQSDRMATLGTLAAGVAHEINNPLSYLSGNLHIVNEQLARLSSEVRAMRERLAHTVGPERATALAAAFPGLLDPSTFENLTELMEDATDGAQRVRSIVGDLKHFTRRDERQRGPVNLREVAERALKIASHEIRHRAHVATRLDEVPPVEGEEGRLAQVFVNLLVNAAQAIPPGHAAENEIRLAVWASGGQVCAEVTDTGGGIPPEVKAKLFQPFVTTKGPGTGSGLGLAICQHIVNDHQGTIEVRSEIGRGTTFSLRFPAADAPAATPRPPEEEAPPAPAGLAHERRARILVVDDEPALVRTLKRDLSREYDVVTVSSGREAIDLLSHDAAFALVLCDIMMLDVSGREVFEWIREHRPALQESIVFITGGTTNAEARHFLDRVENVVIEKPFELPHLRRIVRNLTRTAAPVPAQPAAPAPAPTLAPALRPPAPASRPAPPPLPVPAGAEVASREYRRAPRFQARGMYGVLKLAHEVRRLEVVDYSASGLRVALDGELRDLDQSQVLAVVLNRADYNGVVQAEVRVARRHIDATGQHLCFQIASMNPSSRAQYDSWIQAEA